MRSAVYVYFIVIYGQGIQVYTFSTLDYYIRFKLETREILEHAKKNCTAMHYICWKILVLKVLSMNGSINQEFR